MSEEIELQKKKDFFIEKQIMDNSISAAFRARGGKKGECSIYFDDAVEDEDKEKIRRSLSELIKEYAESYKKNEITPEKHIDNIKSITAVGGHRNGANPGHAGPINNVMMCRVMEF